MNVDTVGGSETKVVLLESWRNMHEFDWGQYRMEAKLEKGTLISIQAETFPQWYPGGNGGELLFHS